MRIQRLFGALALTQALALATGAAAAPILTLPGLSAVRVYETTTATNAYSFAPGDPTLTSSSGVDIATLANSEVYNVFVSDAAGHLDANGRFVTVTGRCDANLNAGCFNIAGVSLLGSGPLYGGGGELFASILSHAVYGHSPIAGSAGLAVDGLLSTFTTLGDTTPTPGNPGPFPDMSVTVGFAGVSDGVPEPAAWALMILGLGGVGAAMRGRRAAAVGA